MDLKRILTSVLGLPAVIAIIVFGNTIVVDIFFAIIAMIAINEYFNAFEKGKTAKPIKWIGYIIALSLAVLRFFHLQSSLLDISSDMINMMFVLLIFAVFVVFFHVLNSGMETTIVDGAITIFGILYIPVLIMFLTLIYSAKNGVILIWYVIICRLGHRHFCISCGKNIKC